MEHVAAQCGDSIGCRNVHKYAYSLLCKFCLRLNVWGSVSCLRCFEYVWEWHLLSSGVWTHSILKNIRSLTYTCAKWTMQIERKKSRKLTGWAELKWMYCCRRMYFVILWTLLIVYTYPVFRVVVLTWMIREMNFGFLAIFLRSMCQQLRWSLWYGDKHDSLSVLLLFSLNDWRILRGWWQLYPTVCLSLQLCTMT